MVDEFTSCLDFLLHRELLRISFLLRIFESWIFCLHFTHSEMSRWLRWVSQRWFVYYFSQLLHKLVVDIDIDNLTFTESWCWIKVNPNFDRNKSGFARKYFFQFVKTTQFFCSGTSLLKIILCDVNILSLPIKWPLSWWLDVAKQRRSLIKSEGNLLLKAAVYTQLIFLILLRERNIWLYIYICQCIEICFNF